MPEEEQFFRVWKTVTFEAGHSLPHLPEGHKCREPHGHSYRMEVHCAGPVKEPEMWVVDYAEIKAAIEEEVLAYVDHKNLNDVGIGWSTTENLARWVWDRLSPRLGPVLERIVIQESASSGCIYRGPSPKIG